MKTTKKGILVVLLHLCIFTAGAQNIPINEPDYNKSLLFADLPDVFELKVTEFESLLLQVVGSGMNFRLADNFLLKGSVVSKSDPADKRVRSVIVKSSNWPGAVLTFTKIFGEDGTYQYMGRILSRENSDAYDLTIISGRYYFKKKHFYDLLNE
ncbi:MAG: hypothetical protein H0U44_06605 [Flavisolibacter sp.]|jgi:hypothetical protein|nr:hypothetical protein [Flavisolibacter sp.]